jgi:hypothetical protein
VTSLTTYWNRSRVSSGSDDRAGRPGWTTGLDDRAIGVRFPAGSKNFSSNLCVQTCSGAHPASCTMGTRFLSPGVKRGLGVTLTTHPHLAPRSKKWVGAITPLPPSALMACNGTALFYFVFTYWNSSDSIASDYGLDDRAIRVRLPAGAKDFSSILWGPPSILPSWYRRSFPRR